MKIFIVKQGINYMGDFIVGVFVDNEEAAESLKDKISKNLVGDEYCIVEVYDNEYVKTS